MQVHTRLFDFTTDYDLVSTWWTEREHVIIPKDFLSNYGVMAFIDNKPIGVMWLYPIVGCKWSMIRFPITTIKSTAEERDLALDTILTNLFGISKDLGASHIFCTTNNPKLIKRLEDLGMTLTSENCKHFWGGL